MHAHDGVAIEILGDDLATLAEDDLAPGGSAQPPQESALDLRANEVRIDDDAAAPRARGVFAWRSSTSRSASFTVNFMSVQACEAFASPGASRTTW